MNQHLLIVGDPGAVPRLLRSQQGPAMTSLCLSADIVKLPGLKFVDRILATGPREESSDAWVATAVSAHRAHPVTRAAVFDPNAHLRAAAVADVLGIALYPRLDFAGVNDHWAVRQRLQVLGCDDVGIARAPDRASLEGYIAGHGLPCLLRSRSADRPAALLRTVADLDRATCGEGGVVSPGAQMVVESVLTGQLFRVAVLVEGGRSEALAILRHQLHDVGDGQRWAVIAGPAGAVAGADGQAAGVGVQAARLALLLGVRDGLLLLDLALDSAKAHLGGVRLGPPGEQTRRAVLQATGVDLTLCCARQACGQPALDRALDSAQRLAVSAVWNPKGWLSAGLADPGRSLPPRNGG